MEIKAAASLLNMRIVAYRLNLSFMYELIADFNNEIYQTENYIILHYVNNIHFELLFGKATSVKNKKNDISELEKIWNKNNVIKIDVNYKQNFFKGEYV